MTVQPADDRTIMDTPGMRRLVDSLPRPMNLFLWEVEARGRAPETIAYYAKHLAQFAEVVDVEKWMGLETREQKAELLRWLMLRRNTRKPNGQQVTPATVSASWRAVRAWCKWLAGEEYITADPTLTIPKQDSGWEPKETYTRADIGRLMALCPVNTRWGARDKVIVCLAVFAGLRRKEIANLNLDNLVIAQSLLSARRTKNKKPRVLDVPPQLRSALVAYLMKWRTGDSPALVQNNRGQRMTPDAVGQVWDGLCRKAGISGRKGPHRGRHTFVTESLRAGGDINDVRLAAGHSSLDMTRRYAGQIEAAEAAQRLRSKGAMKGWG